ncbi:hypothetical protein AAK938_07535 [Aerococcaceae bacterium 50-4]
MYGKVIASDKIMNINNELHVVNPLVNLQVPFLPTTLSFSIFCSFLAENYQNRFAIMIKVSDHKGFVLGSLDGEIDIDTPNSPVNFDINLSNVIFKNDGLHQVELFVEDKQIAEYTFYVYNQNITL